MFTTERQTYRLIVEKELLEKYYPGIRFNRYSDETYFESKATTRSGRMTFRLRIVLPFEYPHAKPKLYVWEPLVLRKWDGSSLNAEGMSHDFHTLSNGPGGRVQIDHCGVWDASMSCTEVLMRGRIWLEGYMAHFDTGESVCDYLIGIGYQNYIGPERLQYNVFTKRLELLPPSNPAGTQETS